MNHGMDILIYCVFMNNRVNFKNNMYFILCFYMNDLKKKYKYI